MAELELREIQKSYQRKKVLRGASLSVEAGTIAGLAGPNGGGKSTLLGILAGVLRPDRGQFLWRGTDLFTAPGLRREVVGYVPQGTPLFEELSALDNLRLWYSQEELSQSLRSGVLHSLGVEDFLRTRVSRMSGGMKKRLSIGCALARRPELLLLDEPAAALDLPGKGDLLRVFRNLRDSGKTLLLASHDLQELEICDRLYLLRDGVLSETDIPALLKAGEGT